MPKKQFYSSSVSVPVYAAWKCRFCKTNNFSAGFIICKRETSSSSWRIKKQEEARKLASVLAQNEWKQNAIDIIFSPKFAPQKMRESLSLNNTRCSRCKLKPRWDRGLGYQLFSSMSFGFALISGFVAVITPVFPVAWLIFFLCVLGTLYGFINAKAYKKAIQRMDIKFLPVIGSQNEELVAFAEGQGKSLLSPEGVIDAVKRY